MSNWHSDGRRSRLLHPSAGAVCAIEILVLMPLAAYLVLGVIPSAFGVEWQCVGELGVQRVPGDSYLDGFAVGGMFGWIVVVTGVIYAEIGESPRLAAVLPIAWFVVLLIASLLVAGSIGSQPCPS